MGAIDKKYKIPKIESKYVNIYKPKSAIFPGPDSPNFKAGKRYENWVPNDFTIIHGCGFWHMFGITHPCPSDFISSKEFSHETIHEAEWQLFHAVSPTPDFAGSMFDGSFNQLDFILPADERPGESRKIWAPIIWNREGRYLMIYSPSPFRMAESEDLMHWKPLGVVFESENIDVDRDPNIMEKDGTYYLVYLASGGVYLRESRDLRSFSEGRRILTVPDGVSAESPILKYIDGWYYLFYCIFDGQDMVNGAYDYRTFVFAAKNLSELDGSEPITCLDAHAPELFEDEKGDWYIASAEWPCRGVSAVRLVWE